MRVLLRVAYDGTEYCGWQVQPNANTVEGELAKALKGLFGAEIEIIGASRTDAGVHAMGNVAVFDTDSRMPAEKISYALNTRLPDDIRVRKSMQVPDDFHPRHTDCVKTYEYNIYNDQFDNPLYSRYSHFCYGEIDVDKMNEAAKYIVGEHDFTAFCAAGSQVVDKTRTVYSLEAIRNDRLITIRITGNGFLYNMVRIIAGTLLKVGQGAMEPTQVQKAIESKNRNDAGPTAPAKGLRLVEIKYKEVD